MAEEAETIWGTMDQSTTQGLTGRSFLASPNGYTGSVGTYSAAADISGNAV